MKTMLISAASAIVMFGIASARDVIVSPVVSHHEIGIAQLSVDREGDVLCTTRYLAITKGDGSKTIHRSEDCDE
jgi:hypothetical protein